MWQLLQTTADEIQIAETGSPGSAAGASLPLQFEMEAASAASITTSREVDEDILCSQTGESDIVIAFLWY